MMSVIFFSGSKHVAKIAEKYWECNVNALCKSQMIKLIIWLDDQVVRGTGRTFLSQNVYAIVFGRKFFLVSE